MLLTAYKCSPEAERLWGRLLSVYALYSTDKDPQMHGMYDSGHGKGYVQDLLTDPRRLHVSAEWALAYLINTGMGQFSTDARAAGMLAEAKLKHQSYSRVQRQYRLTEERANELLEGAKNWLYYHCESRSPMTIDELDLPF